MRVLYVTPNFPDSFSPDSGVFIWRQARHLSEMGCSVDVLVPVPYVPPFAAARRSRIRSLQSFESRDGIRVYRFRYLRPPGRWFLDFEGSSQALFGVAMARKIHRQNSYHLVHSHWLASGGVVGRKLSDELGLPHLCTARGGSIFALRRRSRFLQNQVRFSMRSCARLFAVSSAAAKFLQELLAVPCSVLYNGCDTSIFYPAPSKQLSSKPRFLVVGSVHREKGIFDVIQAFHTALSRGMNAELEIVGTGPEMAAARALADSGPGAGQIVFTGFLDPDLVPAKLRSADALVCASWVEGLSNCVVEASCTGLPVIGTDIPGMNEVVLHGKSGIIVRPGDPLALANAMLQLWKSPECCQSMGQAAARQGRSNFDMRQSAGKLLQIYRQFAYG